MWTYQEILFASTPVVICGNETLDWTRFATSLLFLDITGVADLGDHRQVYNIRTWTSLILSREYFLNIKTSGTAMNETSPQPRISTPTPPLKPDSEASEIQKYLIFHKQMLRLKILRHRILTVITACITACIFTGSIFFCAFLIYESVDRKKFHNEVESMASSIVASVFNHSMTDTGVISGRQISDTGFNSARQTSDSTTSLAVMTPIGISSSLQVSTTSSVDARLTSYSQVLATVVENCYSSCTSYSILTRCFQSCTASQSGKIPQPTEAPFYQAGEVTGKLFEQFFSWIPIVLIPIVSFASDLFELLFVATIGLLTFAWMPYLLRRKLASGKTEIGKLEAIELEVQVNLLDVLYNRRATRNEDRCFALRGIVELLAAAKLPPPDYSKPLGEIYQELTVLMARTTGSLNVLIPAALSSFPDPGYPSWIPDWIAHFDALWTRPPRMWHDQDATPGSTAYWKVDGAYGQKLLVRGRRIAQVISCTRFHETKDPYDAKEKELHLTNIASSQILLDVLSQLGTQSHTELHALKPSDSEATRGLSWFRNFGVKGRYYKV
jgi:hypothetical protein